MRTALPDDVVEFGRAARARFDALGSVAFSGPQFALMAETDPGLRRAAGDALAELGAFDLEVRTDAEQLLAACEVSRTAGAVALPYPLAERLLARDGSWLALIDHRRPFVDHADLHEHWVGATLDDAGWSLVLGEDSSRRKLAPFLRPASLASSVEVAPQDVSVHLVLGSWRVLGTLEAALAQVVAHVKARVQFGKALAEFQVVRFAVADAVVTVRGLSELARYTAWRQTCDIEVARADALALRVHAGESARGVLRTCHQLLGAVGFCDEHDVSVLDRHIQSTTRVPHPVEQLVERLTPYVASEDFETLYTSRAR